MFSRMVVYILVAILSGCSGISTVIVGEVGQAVDTDQVRVFYSSQPDCDFEVVAWIQIPGQYPNYESVVKMLQVKAADLGASAVQVTFTQRTGTTTYRGSGRALRCIT
jgi:uncharacterized protein YceK